MADVLKILVLLQQKQGDQDKINMIQMNQVFANRSEEDEI
jgi:hypothetical protein